MADITIKTIDEILDGTIQDSSPVMFGLGNSIFKQTWGQLKQQISGDFVTDLSYRVIDTGSVVSSATEVTFINSQSVIIEKGEIVFITLTYINNDGLSSKNKYIIPLGEGNYTPLGGSINFSDLILIEKDVAEITGAEPNTTTYNVVDLEEINNANPSFDFTNTELVYFVNIDGTLYHFIGQNGAYGDGDLQMDMDDLNLVSSISQASGLEALNQGNGTGWRYIGRDPLNFGNIGFTATDLSYSDEATGENGATGDGAFASGYNVIASGTFSFTHGNNLLSSSFWSTAIGSGCEATEPYALAIGQNSKATYAHAKALGNNVEVSGAGFGVGKDIVVSENIGTGIGQDIQITAQGAVGVGFRVEVSGMIGIGIGQDIRVTGVNGIALGRDLYSRAVGEINIGRYGTDYTPQGDGADRLLNIAGGDDVRNRKDVFQIFKNGAVRFAREALSGITNAIKEGLLIFNSEDDNRPYIHNGTEWKGLAYNDEISNKLIKETPPTSGTFNINLTRNAGVDYTENTTNIEDIQEGADTELGAFAKVKGNWANKPVIPWATEAENSLFLENETIYLYFEVWADGILYWYSKER